MWVHHLEGLSVAFFGDSITQAGGYVAGVEGFLLSRGVHARFVNLGLASESGTDLTPAENQGHVQRWGFPHPLVSQRFKRTLERVKPDVVFACYGMNDSDGLPDGTQGTLRFGEAMTWLRQTALGSGCSQVVFITPPPHERLQEPGQSAQELRLLDYSRWLVEQRTQGWQVVDAHTCLVQATTERRRNDPAFTLAPDGVHPEDLGHWLIACQVVDEALADGAAPLTEAERLGGPATLYADRGPEIVDLVRTRLAAYHEAWLGTLGHTRPGVPGGPDCPATLSLQDAEKRGQDLGAKITSLLRPTQVPR